MPISFPKIQDITELDPQDLTRIAEESAKEFKEITTNQIRNLYSEIIKIKTQYEKKKSESDRGYDSIRHEFILLKPKLAYMVARNKKMKEFREIFEKFIDEVDRSRDKDRALSVFFDFAEAIVAYHKFYGKK